MLGKTHLAVGVGAALTLAQPTTLAGCFTAIIGGAVAVVVALVSQNIYSAIGVLLYVVVMQQLDANILQPKIISTAMGMRPIYVLFAITVGGGLFGFWVMLISVPLMAIAKIL